jgi:methionyl-tRNA synthetase
MLSFEDFLKLDIRIGTIISAGRVPDSDKLLRLAVNIGEDSPRQIIAGIAEYISPEDLAGRQCPFVVNLEPRTIRGLESQGMLLAIGTDGGFALLHPNIEIAEGAKVR